MITKNKRKNFFNYNKNYLFVDIDVKLMQFMKKIVRVMCLVTFFAYLINTAIIKRWISSLHKIHFSQHKYKNDNLIRQSI